MKRVQNTLNRNMSSCYGFQFEKMIKKWSYMRKSDFFFTNLRSFFFAKVEKRMKICYVGVSVAEDYLRVNIKQ